MSDLISRQAVLELLQMKYFGKDLYKAIYELSSVENKGEWIPVTERLPEVDQNVLATTRWGEVTIAERLNIGSDCWFICEGEANAHTKDIVAWQPLPEPYKTESEDKE